MKTMTSSEDTSNRDMNSDGNSIESFFADSVILITGATGFIGKALLEKLLRSCPRVTSIFLMMRSKKGHTVEERFKELIDNEVFDRIRSECPATLNKVFPIYGDVGLPDLGLSKDNRTMLTQRVNFVFHSAATVRFDEPLRVAVELNTRGTDLIMDLCRNMTNLISFVYVSTAYSNADRFEVKEAIYHTRVKPQTVISMCESLDDATLDMIEQKLIGGHPNTYTWAKNLAEKIVAEKGLNMPVSIVRPGVVGAADRDPFPGWVDNIIGINGVMTEVGRGAIRNIIGRKNTNVDLVPVDIVVNTVIGAAWHRVMQCENEVKIYNCTSSSFNPLSLLEFGTLIQKYAIEVPSKYTIMYPSLCYTRNRFLHQMIVSFSQYVPAYLVDLVLKFQGEKPMMMKLAYRNDRAIKTGAYFTSNKWNFQGDNMNELTKIIQASSDRDSFDTDMSRLDWADYIQKCMKGIRKFVLKDNPDTVVKERSRLLRLYWTYRLIQFGGIALLVRMIARLRRNKS